MINGMEILADTPVTKLGDIFWVIFILGGIVSIVFSVITAVQERSTLDFFICFACFFMLTILIAFPVGISNEQPTGEYVYDVIFHENVDMNEVYDKYDILNKNGKIFTIKEKQNNN